MSCARRCESLVAGNASENFRVIEEYEWVKPLRLDLEPGSAGIFQRDNGEKIFVLFEHDIRDESVPERRDR